jgi:hypothetical protein
VSLLAGAAPLGLVGNCTVLAAGRFRDAACGVSQWREVVALACGDWRSVRRRRLARDPVA